MGTTVVDLTGGFSNPTQIPSLDLTLQHIVGIDLALTPGELANEGLGSPAAVAADIAAQARQYCVESNNSDPACANPNALVSKYQAQIMAGLAGVPAGAWAVGPAYVSPYGSDPSLVPPNTYAGRDAAFSGQLSIVPNYWANTGQLQPTVPNRSLPTETNPGPFTGATRLGPLSAGADGVLPASQGLGAGLSAAASAAAQNEMTGGITLPFNANTAFLIALVVIGWLVVTR